MKMYTEKKILQKIEFEKTNENRDEVLSYYNNLLKTKKQQQNIHKKRTDDFSFNKEDISSVIFQVGDRYVTILTTDGRSIEYSLKLNLKHSVKVSRLDDILQTKQCRHLRYLNFYTERGILFRHIKCPVVLRMHDSRIYELFYKSNNVQFLILTREELYGENK